MEIVIASDRERENLFAEVREAGATWAEVIYDDSRGGYALTIFPPVSEPDPKDGFVFDFDEAVAGLREAKARLIERGFPRTSIS